MGQTTWFHMKTLKHIRRDMWNLDESIFTTMRIIFLSRKHIETLMKYRRGISMWDPWDVLIWDSYGWEGMWSNQETISLHETLRNDVIKKKVKKSTKKLVALKVMAILFHSLFLKNDSWWDESILFAWFFKDVTS